MSADIYDVLIVAKFTMSEIIKRKSFRISFLIMLILIVVGFNVPNLISAFDNGNDDKILLSDPQGIFDEQVLDAMRTDSPYELVIEKGDVEAVRKKVTDDEAVGAFVFEDGGDGQPVRARYFAKKFANVEVAPQQILERLAQVYQADQLRKLKLTEAQLKALTLELEPSIESAEETEIGGNIMVIMLLSIVLFFAIYFCAYQVSSSITVEKTSKIMETLVTSTQPRSIILGKTLGIGLVGLAQVAILAGVAIICARNCLSQEMLEYLFDLSTFTPYLVVMILLYFVLGYTVYALLYALTGSTVSRPEEVQAANAPVVFLTMISFYLAYFTLINPTSGLNFFAALFPFSAPFCMPLRIMMKVANGWEVAASILILLATCALVAYVSIRIYSNAILNYGTKMSLKEIWKNYRQK